MLITGLEKAVRTVFTDKQYAGVRMLGDEYKKRRPRSVASRAPAPEP